MNYGKDAIGRTIKRTSSKKRKYFSKFVLGIFEVVLVFVVFIGAVGTSIGVGAVMGIIAEAPEIDMESIVPQGLATSVYDSAGNLTDTLVMAGSNRDPATYDELPEDLINAFVAIEDARFWTHNGIDLRSIVRMIMGVLTGDSSAGGGSTITQQLIKNNVFNGGSENSFGETVERKLQEQYLAVKLTQTMDKKLILTNYLNTINLGNNCLGVKVAARRYFGKEVSDLTLSECAVIAGITQNPSRLNPISGQERNAERREVILQNMYEQGYITKEQQEEALADDVYERIQTVDAVTRENETPYSYFTDELTQQVRDALVDKLGYSETQAYNLLYGGGLSIYTTQDPEIQAIVDEEINNPDNYNVVRYSMEYRLSVTHADGSTEHFSQNNLKTWRINVLGDTSFDALYRSEEEARADAEAYKEYQLAEGDEVLAETITITLQPQASFVIMEQSTGQVKAISGGRGEKTANLTLNRATRVTRQPGSTFKVITAFAPALDTCGATLGTVYYDAPYTVGDHTFKNWYTGGYMGYSNIREGIVYSMNIVAVRCLMETVTPQLGVEYAKNFGITTLTDTDANAALALGGITEGVTNLELTAAYAAIANGGVYTEPIFFTKILDHNGKILLDNEPETHRVIKDSTAFLLTDAMTGVLESSRKYSTGSSGPTSTSPRAHLESMSAAAKSGTTSDNNDIWFVGYTPYYTAGIWSGYDLNQKLSSNTEGTSYHKDIWKKIMDRVHEGLPDPGFEIPDSIETAEICRKSGLLPISGVCNHDSRGSAVYTEYFAKGTVPEEACNTHVAATACSITGRLATSSCYSRYTRIFISIPEGEEEGDTDDSRYAMPGYCYGHSGGGTAVTSEAPVADGSSDAAPVEAPAGPGYAPTVSDGSVNNYIPVQNGPGV